MPFRFKKNTLNLHQINLKKFRFFIMWFPQHFTNVVLKFFIKKTRFYRMLRNLYKRYYIFLGCFIFRNEFGINI